MRSSDQQVTGIRVLDISEEGAKAIEAMFNQVIQEINLQETSIIDIRITDNHCFLLFFSVIYRGLRERLGCIWLCRCFFHVYCFLLCIQRHRFGWRRARRTSTTITAFSYSARGLLPFGRTTHLAQRRFRGSCTYCRSPSGNNQNTATP